MNNTMVQEDRQKLWCDTCKNADTKICERCVFAGCPTRYEFNRPTILKAKECKL